VAVGLFLYVSFVKQAFGFKIERRSEVPNFSSPAEHMRAVRYRPELPLNFRWENSQRSQLQGDGMARYSK
jgi:hypothetical protein